MCKSWERFQETKYFVIPQVGYTSIPHKVGHVRSLYREPPLVVTYAIQDTQEKILALTVERMTGFDYGNYVCVGP